MRQTTEARTDVRENIKEVLEIYTGSETLFDSSTRLLKQLGYESPKVNRLDSNTINELLSAFGLSEDVVNHEKALAKDWKKAELVFQYSESELKRIQSLFDTDKIDTQQFESFLFLAIELKEDHYKRTDLVAITREINKPFLMPVILLFHYGRQLTISIIDRRTHKRNSSKDVLEKVTLIKDINLDKPHRAHLDILKDLSLQELNAKRPVQTFPALLSAWKEVLNISQLNNRFYEKLLHWYLWAVRTVKYPQQRATTDHISDNHTHQSESVIRLLTRLLFCWFMREKQELIPDDFFNQNKLKQLLINFDISSKEDGTYYQAILQNLFFATLSVPAEDRKYIGRSFQGKNAGYGDTTIYRFEEAFVNKHNPLEIFKSVPFLNGGLFECLDRVPKGAGETEVRLDGFSTTPLKQAFVPNYLFWGDHHGVDLSEELGNSKKNAVTVTGLLDILTSYKFTIEENTPLDEEIALDPELLGRTFENLLGYFNKETRTAARNNTGSFYTPREVVDYMVDESLAAYLNETLRNNPLFQKRTGLQEEVKALLIYNDKSHNFSPEEVKEILNALDVFKIVDPACGSGAFPMGILQKVVWLLRKLDPNNSIWFNMLIERFPSNLQETMRDRLKNEEWDYLRKLGLIQQSIYGIDIQPIAIQIAKLRFFISLLVDQKPKPNENNKGLLPLPNLDFKLVCANTLVHAPDSNTEFKGKAATLEFGDTFQDDFKKLTTEYFSTTKPKEKLTLRKKIESIVKNKTTEKEKEINKLATHHDERYNQVMAVKNKGAIEKAKRDARLWASYPNLFKQEAVGFYENKYFFPEVSEGFHAVIGNPPYVQLQKLDAPMKAELEAEAVASHYATYTRTGDLYQLFYERGASLLRPNGHLCYITSNKWMRAAYGESTRKWLGENTRTLALIDFGMALVFESATTLTNILLFQKTQATSTIPMCRVKTGDYTKGTLLANYAQAHTAYVDNPKGESWVAYRPEEYTLIKRIEALGKPLYDASVWDLRINYGLKTGYNEAFIIPTEVRDRLVAEDAASAEIIRPILRGEDIQPYVPEWAGEWLINIPWHFPLHLDESISGASKKAEKQFAKEYPSVYAHLSSHKKGLAARNKAETGIHYEWYCLQRWGANYHEDFSQSKIIYPNMTKFLPFCYDEEGYMTNQKCFIMTGKHLKYLTVVLNSSLWKFAFKDRFPELLGETFELSKVFFEKIPLKHPPNLETEQLFNVLLDAIQAATATSNLAAVQLFTRLADAAVYELYFPHIRNDGAATMQHLQNVLSRQDWQHEKSRNASAAAAYAELSNPKHPVAVAMFKLSVQPEVQLIESVLHG